MKAIDGYGSKGERHAGWRALRLRLASLLAAALVAGCGGGSYGGGGTPASDFNSLPAGVQTVASRIEYDGLTDDLLTAGLGANGLASGTVPTTSTLPSAAELRRLAIYNNYRAIVDTTAAGGYGTLYGPSVDANGVATGGQGKIAGGEYIAYLDDGTGQQNVTLMVQVPASFDRSKACVITATSSGSRGVYGAISTGEWGLKHGCAVAYTDKGTGAAPHDLQNDTVPLIDGTRTTSAVAQKTAQFRANLSASDLAAFNAATPNRFAFKHAHSQRNPEKDWGRFTLSAIDFAFFVLNDRLGDTAADGRRLRTFKPQNTIVIASSISNGGAAALAAAEADTLGVIDGVAVSEPALEMPLNPNIGIQRGATPVFVFAKPLIDYTTYANLLQSCAALSSQLSGSPFQAAFVTSFGAIAANRCASLHAKRVLTHAVTADQADEALQLLRNYGWEPESNDLHASLAAFEVAPAVSVTFANALTRSSVADRLCGYSFAATTAAGDVVALPPTALSTMFATGNGVPPSAGVQLVNDLDPGGPRRDLLSSSPSTALADWNVDGALCLRDLVVGVSTSTTDAMRVGVDETRRNGNLHGKPVIIVHGRADALIPVNHSSRAYTALNKTVEPALSRLSYMEVTNAQHFDSFIGLPGVLPGYDTRYIPLHVYLFRALDAIYGNLASGTALPPSQVVRTIPRGGAPGFAPAITPANVPPFAIFPLASDSIKMSGNTLLVPD
jgi:hydroxybutyrate-dimer hydrolase